MQRRKKLQKEKTAQIRTIRSADNKDNTNGVHRKNDESMRNLLNYRNLSEIQSMKNAED
jgi:hypothetical protein